MDKMDKFKKYEMGKEMYRNGYSVLEIAESLGIVGLSPYLLLRNFREDTRRGASAVGVGTLALRFVGVGGEEMLKKLRVGLRAFAASEGVTFRVVRLYLEERGLFSEVLDWIKSDYLGGMALGELAAKYGITLVDMNKLLEEVGISKADRNTAIANRMYEDYRGGMSIVEVANKYGLSAESVYTKLRGKPKVRPPSERRLEILRLREEGKSIREIAEMFGISRQAVDQHLKSRGV